MKKLFILTLGIVAAVSATAQTLKETIGKDVLVGTALSEYQIMGNDSKALELTKQQFNCIVAENCMKPQELHPSPDVWKWDVADKMIEFAQQNKITVNGHCLVWHSQVPMWFFFKNNEMPKGFNPFQRGNMDKSKLKSREELLQLMKEHIFAVVGHFKGKVIGWDVVNEAFEDNGSMRNSLWRQIIGDDFIEKAFEYAHEADPNAELYYNDYSMNKPAKVKGICEYIRNMKKKGIRIDAVGMQSHIGLDYPDFKEYEQAISDFASLGVKVMFTELDINVLPNPQQFGGAEISQNFELQEKLNPYVNGLPKAKQKELENRYVELFKIYKRHKKDISRITFWGVNDGQSWLNGWPVRGRTNYPLLFDRDYKAKPALKKICKLWK